MTLTLEDHFNPNFKVTEYVAFRIVGGLTISISPYRTATCSGNE